MNGWFQLILNIELMLNYRKDSFITHRAFCDALAEESARLTSVATTSLNFKNQETVISSQPSLGLENNVQVISQFGPHGYGSDFNGLGMGADQQRPSLSMWLNQGNPLDVGPNSGLYGSSSSPSGLPDHMVQLQMAQVNNAFGMPASNSISTNASLSLSSGKKLGEAPAAAAAAGGGTGNLAPISKPASPMSATALLQKAAQMGSTRSSNNNNNPSIFSGSLGVMTSSSSHTTSTCNLNGNINFSSTTSAAPAMLASSHDNHFGSLTSHAQSHTSNATLQQLVMQTHGKQRDQQVQLKLYPGGSEHNHFTRDFLGMGGGGGAGPPPPPPFLPHELAKFASIGSPMGLTQFTANH